MAASTTSASLASIKSETKELCSICESRPYDLICTCGDKFDFNCIQQHVEQISVEFQDQYQEASDKIIRIDDLRAKKSSDLDDARVLIDDWKRKRIRDINDIADKASDDLDEQENTFLAVQSFHTTYDQISAELHRIVHENLSILIKLNRDIQEKTEQYQDLPAPIDDDGNLDALLQAKLNPSTTITNEATCITNNVASSPTSLSSLHMANRYSVMTDIEPITPAVPPSPPRNRENATEIREHESTVDLTNTSKTNDSTTDTTDQDEFEAGKTRFIQRTRPILIPTGNDKFAATVCCHKNELLYNDYDPNTQDYRLVFIPNVNNPTFKQTIVWEQPDTSTDLNHDEWIQDIVYSDKLSSYLLLSRARLCRLKENADRLKEFHVFTNRTMKRLACSEKYIYLISSCSTAPFSGDEIILMNYDKQEKLCKTFRDVLPSRINRGAGPLAGDISDIAVGVNEQVTIGYRLERRHEVGVCLFNVTNDGQEWACVKQLLLNECWHSDLSYTPRIDWCEELDIFMLIEYMTGHLIMIDRDGQIQGECRFMQAENRRESPINLTVSTNNWFCVRYETSISIHEINS